MFRKAPRSHLKILHDAKTLIKSGENIFVHGGLEVEKSLEDQDEKYVAWDRDFIEKAMKMHKKDKNYKFLDANNIYTGHTPTLTRDTDKPQKFCNVWCLDTGSGLWHGKLTIMDIDTEEYWQSDSTWQLYADGKIHLTRVK